MKVQSVAECSPRSILQYFWPALLAIIGLENQFAFFRVAVLHGFYCNLIEPSAMSLYCVFWHMRMGQDCVDAQACLSLST